MVEWTDCLQEDQVRKNGTKKKEQRGIREIFLDCVKHFIFGHPGAKEGAEAEALLWAPRVAEVAVPRGEGVGQGVPAPQPQ